MDDELDADELAIVVMPAAAGRVTPFFATDTSNGAPALGLRLDPREGIEWPWGGREPVVIGLGRDSMATFLGEVTEVAERVYQAGGADHVATDE